MTFEGTTSPQRRIELSQIAAEKVENTAQVAESQLAEIELQIAALESEPQTEQLDVSIQRLREKALFMRQAIDNAETVEKNIEAYQREQLKHMDGTQH